MVEVIIYLMESSVMLALFYLLYWFVLRKETFFSVSRFFLIGAPVASLLLPLISIEIMTPTLGPVERPIEAFSNFRMSYYDAIAGWEFDATRGRDASVAREPTGVASVPGSFEIIMFIILIIYAVGVVVILSKNVWTIRWIKSLIGCSATISRDGVIIIKIPQPIAPFSFFRYVFVHDAIVDTPEFDQILAHEKTHIEQRHSFDLVFIQILAAFLWFNPIVWQLIKSLKTTHEYIADRRIINSGYSLVEYQTLLLKQLISNNSFGLVHNFNLSFIKKRITMMKNKRSGRSGKIRAAMAIAATLIVSVAIIQCNTKLDDVSNQSGNADSDGFNGVNLPVLPKTDNHFDGDHADALTFVIAGDKLTIDGKFYQSDDITSVIKNTGLPSLNGHIVLVVDKNQKMGLVREVEMELRKADRRKILYVGVGTDGSKIETPIMLPPTIEEARRLGVFVESDLATAEAKGITAILKFKAGDNPGNDNQQKVYSFVKEQLDKSSTDYVVSLKYDDGDNYGAFLTNLHFIREGYIQIYQERSQALFGKDYYDISKEEYKAVRMNAPMAISIAEADRK
jgi:hypothetical protein